MMNPQLTDEELQEIRIRAQKIYPGRSLEQLSEQEVSALFDDFDTRKEHAASLLTAPMSQGRQVGNVYVAASPWEALGTAAQRGLGGYMLGKARQDERAGRQAAADLKIRQSALDQEADDRRWDREAKRREDWLRAILAR